MARLVPMSSDDYGPFMEQLIQGYADSHVRAGRWTPEEAAEEARKETGRLLPKGLETPGHLFFTILSEAPEQNVGALWLAIEPRGGFVYDLVVSPQFRGHGYGEQAMRLAEDVVRDRGEKKLSLHVFGDNLVARNLYKKLGYVETNVIMAKDLSP